MRINKVLAVFKKDYREMRRSEKVWTILIPSIIIVIVTPLINLLHPEAMTPQTQQQIEEIIAKPPPEIASEIQNMSPEQALRYMIAIILAIPIFTFFPLIVSVPVATDSFAGEKERKTIESLLAAPITIKELLLGKMFLSFSLSVCTTWINFILYALIVNIVNYPFFHTVMFPNIFMILFVVTFVPLISFFGVSGTVIISARARSMREAQQLAGILILALIPIIAVLLISGLFLSKIFIILFSLFLLALDIILFIISVNVFEAENLVIFR